MTQATDDLTAATSASVAEQELLLAALASANTTLTAVSAQLAALQGNTADPAVIEAAVTSLKAETAKIAGVLNPPPPPAA